MVIRGEERPGKRVDAVFVEPALEAASAFSPKLRWLAIDIETDREGRIVTASLAEAAAGGEILFLQGPGKSPTAPGIEVFPDEASLLGALAARIARRDPDVLTGWNVIDFDFRTSSRAARLTASPSTRAAPMRRPRSRPAIGRAMASIRARGSSLRAGP